MISFLRILNNIKVGDFLHLNGAINRIASSDIIGVCVIPSNFLPDNKARFISMAAMDFKKEEKGNYSFNPGMPWYFNFGTLNHSRKILTSQSSVIPFDMNSDGTISAAGFTGYLPIMTDYYKDNTIMNPQDSGTKYFIGVTGRVPSPYAPNGSFNSKFHYKGSKNNWALTDYRGDLNTKEVISFKESEEECCPAFHCCERFSPGYRNHEWYLPAIGELAFISPRLKIIWNKIKEAINAGSPGITPSTGRYWSSTERSDEMAWCVTLHTGYIDHLEKHNSNCVRAFLTL